MGRQRISGKSIVMRGRWREDRVGWWNRGGVKPALLSNSNYGHYLRYSDSTPSCICNHGLTIMLQHLSRMERDTLQKSISIFRWISLDRFFATQPFGVAPCAGLFQMRQQEAGVDMLFFIGIDVLMKDCDSHLVGSTQECGRTDSHFTSSSLGLSEGRRGIRPRLEIYNC